MFALFVLMAVAIGALLLSLVSIVALLSLLRLQRGYAATSPVLSNRADLSLAISMLSPSLTTTVTIHRPHSPRPTISSPTQAAETSRPTTETVIPLKLDKKLSEDHNVQPLLDYLKEAIAERATG